MDDSDNEDIHVSITKEEGPGIINQLKNRKFAGADQTRNFPKHNNYIILLNRTLHVFHGYVNICHDVSVENRPETKKIIRTSHIKSLRKMRNIQHIYRCTSDRRKYRKDYIERM